MLSIIINKKNYRFFPSLAQCQFDHNLIKQRDQLLLLQRQQTLVFVFPKISNSNSRMALYIDVMIAFANQYRYLLVVRRFHVHFHHVERIVQFRIHTNVSPIVEWQLGQISQPLAWQQDRKMSHSCGKCASWCTRSGPNRRIIYVVKLSTTIPAQWAHWLLAWQVFLLQQTGYFSNLLKWRSSCHKTLLDHVQLGQIRQRRASIMEFMDC